MRLSKLIRYPAIGWVLVMLVSCGDGESDTSNALFKFKQPPHFPEPTYTFDNNPVTKKGFNLGKKLFFDPLLSRDNSVSCNNCHLQALAFADNPQHALSIGIDDKEGIRNAPALMNMAFMSEFFWDGGVTHLDFVPINAIESDFEMDETLSNVIDKLNANEEYRKLFKEAFGIEEITSPFMLHALSQFTVMMVSANSKYDQYVLKGEKLTEQELSGLALFQSKCQSCHEGELFSDFSYRNNGLNETFPDLGRGRITEDEQDNGKFRVPSLRNVGLTAPYMHDGQFATLMDVLDHYSSGMVYSETLDPLFIEGEEVVGISLSDDEKTDIIAFLNTLTDTDFTTDERFRND